MRLLAVALALACVAHGDDSTRMPGTGHPWLAGLGESVPGIFVKLVNDALKGRIAPGAIHYVPPSSVVLEDTLLYDPDGVEVGRVNRARATLSLSSLLSGDIVISRIDLDNPVLQLTLKDGKLNLLEALTPRKPPDKSKPNNTAFRIDAIAVRDGRFAFADGKNVTVTAKNIDATATLEVDLGHDLVIVDVNQPSIRSGMVQLAQLDVPITGVSAREVRILKDRLELSGVTGRAAGAAVKADGTLVLKDPGSMSLHGTVDGPVNAWPDRLKRLPFETPALHALVDVVGPFSDPHVLVDGTFQKATAYGYTVDSGRGVVDVNKDQVRLKDGTSVKAGGTVGVTGTVTFPALELDLKLRAADVPLAAALQPAHLEPAPKGTVSGRATLSGIADGEKPIVIDANLTARRAEMTSVKMRGELEATARVTVRPRRVSLETVTLRAPGVEGHASGDVFTEEERIALKVDVTAENATEIVPAVPPELKAAHARFDGTVAGPYKAVKVDGRLVADNGDAYGVPIRSLDAHLVAGADEVLIDTAHAVAADGTVDVTKPVRLKLSDKHLITGTATIAGVHLASIRTTAGAPLPIAGRADGEAVLSGPYDDPLVAIRAAAGGVVIKDEDIGQMTIRGTVTRKLLTITDAHFEGPLLTGSSDDIRLNIPNLSVDGHVHVGALNLARVHAASGAGLTGKATGLVVVRGDVYAPDLVATLVGEDLAVGQQKLGDGAINITLRPDLPSTTAEKRHIASIATRLSSSLGVWDVAASYAIEREVVNARANLTDVDLAPFTQQLGTSVAPLEGFASGSLDVAGPLDHLNARVRLRAAEVAVAHEVSAAGDARPDRAGGSEKTPAATNVAVLRPLGSLLVDGSVDDGTMTARVCAFPTPGDAPARPPEGSPCSGTERVWATVAGNVDARRGTFDLSVDGQVEEKSLEDLLPAVATRGLAVGAKARASAQLVKEVDKPLDVRAQATLLEGSVQPQGSVRASLVGTSEILYADGRVQLVTPARFAAPDGDVDVVLGGSVGTEDIAIDVNGAVALGVVKAFATQVANASGTAATTLRVRGRYATGVTIEGALTPTPGAVVTPRSLGLPITFLGGGVRFAPMPGAEAGLIRVTAVNLRARVGDGDVTLKGTADVRTARLADQGLVAHWDLAATGTGVEIRLPAGRAEGAMDLVLTGDEDAPKLRGRVEVTEGVYRKTFELRNFVLQAPLEKESEPLWVTLTPIGLENLELDVLLALQNFRARANVANFNADVQLRGNLHLRNSLRLPQLDGAVEVEEGTVDFPRARFEVVEMQMEFPPNGTGALNPQIHLNARAELPPGAAGTNDTEIPVDLYIDGDLAKGLNVDLVATDPQREWSRADLLGLILFGKTIDSTLKDRDTSIALRALMSEAAAPLTAELESLAQRTLGVQLELDPGGWRWQLGRRLQLEGPGILVNQSTSTATNDQGLGSAALSAQASTSFSSSSTSSTASDAVRLRLMILDHVWVGKNLSLEGSTGSTGTDLRMQLRLFEE